MPKRTKKSKASAATTRKGRVQRVVRQIGPMPTVYARRPYEDDKPGGYQESFRDWAANNCDAVTWFLQNADAIKAYLPNGVICDGVAKTKGANALDKET